MNRLRQFDPDIDRIVFVVDGDTHFQEDDKCFLQVPVRAIVEPDLFKQICFRYTAFELSNAIKAFASNFFVSSPQYDAWMYFDSDIMVNRSCRELFCLFGDSSVIVSPHLLAPVPEESVIPLESNLLRYGVYNGGWMVFRRATATKRFLAWFTSRLSHLCFNEFKSTFVDQLWLNLAVDFFDCVSVLRHPGVNVGYWNIHERQLSRDLDGSVLCNALPLYFLHFSCWNPQTPDVMCIYFKNIHSSSDVWLELAQEYSRELFKMGYLKSDSIIYGFDHFMDGSKIDLHHRRHFDYLLQSGKWPENRSPFVSRRYLESTGAMRQIGLGKIVKLVGRRLMKWLH